MERLRVLFKGSVQGVGFRATARRLASGFAVSGWVRNEPDLTVLMEVQGLPVEVERYLAALRERMARFIRSEQSSAVATLQGEAGFDIRG
jgi:acylphosphatase